MLIALNKAGKRLYLATSKPEIFAKKILEHFNLDSYFKDIVGSELNGDRVEKAEVIKCVIDRHDIKDAVMVGDRSFDVLGAKENGISSCGVLYGYGTKKELEDAKAGCIVESVAELKDLLLF